ncbi:MAG: glycoside hydrolase family 38 C-terminal domain-containing protein [Candidatus Cloacimonadaceae bacterium]|nr:glycoside hydrolase family 38 C-terminal domain-containing protein [Candidatus Cloacimonadaceae bacterium]
MELRADEPFIRITHRVDFQEKHRMLRSHFYPITDNAYATYDIQSAVIKRSTKPKNQWEAAMFEVPAHRFADLSRTDYGCALLSEDKYGYRIMDGEMELNLLRSPADVDPNADNHFHEYSYGFYPHTGDYEHSDVYHQAQRFASHLFCARLDGLPEQRSFSYAQRLSASVAIDCIKPTETGDGLIIRMHEYSGAAAMAELYWDEELPPAWLCNLLEEPLKELDRELDYNILRLEFKPYEIKTLLLLPLQEPK